MKVSYLKIRLEEYEIWDFHGIEDSSHLGYDTVVMWWDTNVSEGLPDHIPQCQNPEDHNLHVREFRKIRPEQNTVTLTE
jgi:hypothetical protein